MLKSPDNDARGYALFLGELTNSAFTIHPRGSELFPMGARHEKVGRPSIGLGLDVGTCLLPIRPVDEDTLLAVEKEMGGLVKQAEPEMIACFMASAKLDHCLTRDGPPSRATERGPWERFDERKHNAGVVAELPRLFYGTRHRGSCECSNFL